MRTQKWAGRGPGLWRQPGARWEGDHIPPVERSSPQQQGSGPVGAQWAGLPCVSTGLRGPERCTWSPPQPGPGHPSTSRGPYLAPPATPMPGPPGLGSHHARPRGFSSVQWGCTWLLTHPQRAPPLGQPLFPDSASPKLSTLLPSLLLP